MKPLTLVFVGELNPYGTDPRFALYHLPRRASGNRLREHLGLFDSTYEHLEKVNLCTGRWSMKAARAATSKIMVKYDRIVLLGAKAREAFKGPEPFILYNPGGANSFLTLPHPSGLNRLWDVPGARERARSVMQLFAPEIPWGEISTCG